MLKKWFQRVPKWNTKNDQRRQKACSGRVSKKNLNKVSSPGSEKVKFCSYLLYFSKVGGLRKGHFFGDHFGYHLGDKIDEIGVQMNSKKSYQKKL